MRLVEARGEASNRNPRAGLAVGGAQAKVVERASITLIRKINMLHRLYRGIPTSMPTIARRQGFFRRLPSGERSGIPDRVRGRLHCPRLNPIERLWGIMHKPCQPQQILRHTRPIRTKATPGFPREKVPQNWAGFRDSVTDNFRIIKPGDFRVMT